MPSSHTRAGLILACLLHALLVVAAVPARAQQPCTTDFQCQPYAGGNNLCLGDTLILRRSVCVAGICQTSETGRVNCNPPSGAGVCQGNTFVKGGGRCDALSGRCSTTGATTIACVKTCSCRGNVLAISTGMCTPGAGCGQAVMRCKTGCTCQPEPRCLEDPVPKAKKK